MKILHLTPDDYKTSAWSGGTTTEIFIWPAGADYAARQFQLRISSARVDLPESDFTPLPGVERFITPLTGGFTLTHPGQTPIALEPLSTPYRFSGETPTHCVGTATDFNLMLKGVPGEMTLEAGRISLKPGFHCFYAPKAADLGIGGESHRLDARDALVIFNKEALIVLADSTIIHCQADI